MKAKPYINLCRNVVILEQADGSPGKTELGGMVPPVGSMIAAKFADEMNTKQRSDLLKKHTEAAHESGDVDTHFTHYMRSIQSINPKADEKEHRKDFEDVVKSKKEAESRTALEKIGIIGSRISSALGRRFGLGEELEKPVMAAVNRVMDTIGEMDKSETKRGNAEQIALIVNATGKRLPKEHHQDFKAEVKRRISEIS